MHTVADHHTAKELNDRIQPQLEYEGFEIELPKFSIFRYFHSKKFDPALLARLKAKQNHLNKRVHVVV